MAFGEDSAAAPLTSQDGDYENASLESPAKFLVYTQKKSLHDQFKLQTWQAVVNLQFDHEIDRFLVGSLYGEGKDERGVKKPALDESVRLNIATICHDEWQSYLELRFYVRWLDKQKCKRNSQINFRFAHLNTSGAIKRQTWPTLNAEEQAEYTKAFDIQGDTRQLARTAQIYFLRLQFGKNVYAVNAYNDHTYGSQQETVDRARSFFSRNGTVSLMVRGAEGQYTFEKLNRQILDQRTNDRTAGFYFSKEPDAKIRWGQVPPREDRPTVLLPRQITYPDQRSYVTAYGFALLQELEVLDDMKRVNFSLEPSFKTIKRDIYELEVLQDVASREHWQYLLGNRFDTLERRSSYGVISSDSRAEKVARCMFDIHEGCEQHSVLTLAENLPGPVMIVEGVGGAGKTRTAINLAMPFVNAITAYGRRTQVLILANNNAAVDRLITLVKTRFATLGLTASVGRWRSPSDTNMEDFKDMVASMSLKVTVEEHVKTQVRSNDARLQLIDDSFGQLMYRRSGLEDKDSLANPDKNVHASFREHFRRKVLGEDPRSENNRAFTEAMNKLRADLLSVINIVVTTATNAADFALYKNFQPVLIIADDMGRLSETAIWPFISYYDANIIILGDLEHPRPMVNSTLENNGFVDLLGLSILQRLVQAGAPTVKLYQQYRYSNDTLKLINKVFYNDSVTTHPSVMERPGIIEGQSFINWTYGLKGRNVVMLNIPNTQCKQLGSSPSKFNELEAFHILNVLEQMVDFGIPAKDIGVAIPYTTQKMIILRGIAGLKTRRPEHDWEDVEAFSFDGFEGRERRCMIVGLTVTKNMGFLADGSRVNVAITRNKDCLVCIANVAQMERYVHGSQHAVSKVVDNFKRLHAVVQIDNSAVPEGLKMIMPSSE